MENNIFTITESEYDVFRTICSFSTIEAANDFLKNISEIKDEYNKSVDDVATKIYEFEKNIGLYKSVEEVTGQEFKDRGKFPGSGGNVQKLYPEIWKQRREADSFNEELRRQHDEFRKSLYPLIEEERKKYNLELKETYPLMYKLFGRNRIHLEDLNINKNILIS